MGELSIPYTVIGEVTDQGVFEYGNVHISMDEALKGLDRYVRGGIPDGNRKEEKTGEEARVEEKLYHTDAVYICDHKIRTANRIYPRISRHQLRI